MPQDFREIDAMLARARGKREPGAPKEPRVEETDRACAGCGYSLRGLREGTLCPECGMPSLSKRERAAPRAVAASGGAPWVGMALVIGWPLVLVGWVGAWLGFIMEQLLFMDAPRESIAMAGCGLAAVGAALAAAASARLLVAGVSPAMREAHAGWVRWAALLGPVLWGVTSVCGAVASFMEWQGGSSGPPLWVLWGVLAAGALTGVYTRVMYTLAELMDDGEAANRLRTNVAGMPLSVAATCFIVVWSEAVRGAMVVPTISIFTLLMPAFFVLAMMGLGNGLRWAKRNMANLGAREQRRMDRWQKQAEKDREKERRFGNSTQH